MARLLVESGRRVIATGRSPDRLRGPPVERIAFDTDEAESWKALKLAIAADTRVLHSIPSSKMGDPTTRLMEILSEADRIVYLSTTGVYGDQVEVSEDSQPAPTTPRQKLRAEAEKAVLQFGRSLVLRPAAIYGPFRGIHASMRKGEYHLNGDGSRYVSRIHVDDLAAHCVAALLGDAEGAWPVADEAPCPAAEIARFCAELLHLPLPAGAKADQLSETRRANRRVDGTAIRGVLGIGLRYPNYREGIPACIAAEAVEREF